MSHGQSAIDRFFQSSSYAVVGASNNREKYGNRVFRKYIEKGLSVDPVSPKESTIEGCPAFQSVKDLPAATKSISVVTPPAVTEQIVREAVEAGIQNIWMQPGSESDAAVAYAQKHGVNVIADGSCVLVAFATDPRFLVRRGNSPT